MDEKLSNKIEKLQQYLQKLQKVAVAFSGGVDSTFLLFIANKVLKENAIGLVIRTPYVQSWEVNDALIFAQQQNITCKVIDLEIPESIKNNPENRCYLCKTTLFGRLKSEADSLDINHVLDGTNADDLHLHRPGFRALSELRILSPLKDCDINKSDIRALSKKYKLPTWNKPAYACLLTRIPYNTKYTVDDLKQIESAELSLEKWGFGGARVRKHGNLARIEIPRELMMKFMEEETRVSITEELKSLGFRFVTLDTSGYKSGSFDR